MGLSPPAPALPSGWRSGPGGVVAELVLDGRRVGDPGRTVRRTGRSCFESVVHLRRGLGDLGEPTVG